MTNFTKKSTEFLILKFLKDTELKDKVTEPTLRRKYAYLEAWLSIVSNLVLALVKIILGVMLNSISMLADAAHTASDVITSVVVLLGFKLSALPADEEHPYGHGRIEFLASLIIAIMLLFVGLEFGKSSYDRLISNTAVKGSYLVALLMVGGALFKEWLAGISIELGNRTTSSALIADAWHHRTDAIASLLVAAAIVASKFGYYKVDAILGFLVSALIIYTGYEIAKDAISKIIGEGPEKDEIKDIESKAFSINGVKNVHKVNVHKYGGHKEISLHIQVDDNLSLKIAHDISDKVEKLIEENKDCNAVVHVDPVCIHKQQGCIVDSAFL